MKGLRFCNGPQHFRYFLSFPDLQCTHFDAKEPKAAKEAMRGCECIGIENKALLREQQRINSLANNFFAHLPLKKNVCRLVASKPTSMTSPSAILAKSVEAARLEDGSRPLQIIADSSREWQHRRGATKIADST